MRRDRPTDPRRVDEFQALQAGTVRPPEGKSASLEGPDGEVSRGDRMARGWHYTKLSLSSALLLSFSGMCFVCYCFFLFYFLFCFLFCFHTLVGAL